MCKKIIVYECENCGALRKTFSGIQQHENCCNKTDKNYVKQKLKLTKNGELKGVDREMGG